MDDGAPRSVKIASEVKLKPLSAGDQSRDEHDRQRDDGK
jgi:hypothetical protein